MRQVPRVHAQRVPRAAARWRGEDRGGAAEERRSTIIGISREITPEWKQSYSKTILIKFDVSNSNSKNNFRFRR